MCVCVCINGRHRKQLGGCEVKRINPKTDQQYASPEAELKNLIGQ